MSVKVKNTDWERARVLAETLHIPISTVATIGREWDKSRIADILDGKDTAIVGLVSLSLEDDEEAGTMRLRCRPSEGLRARVRELGEGGARRRKRIDDIFGASSNNTSEESEAPVEDDIFADDDVLVGVKTLVGV